MLSMKSRLLMLLVGLLLIGVLTACAAGASPSAQSTYPVDAPFTDFYHQFGGVNTLGPAISSAFTDQGLTYQYVVSGLMVYDPNQAALQRFYFSPLASEQWKINGLVEPAPADPQATYVNGHQVWGEVQSFYQQYGANLIGLPLTGVTANDARQRYEQFFEGLGFYRGYAEAPGQIHLMPYGAWMCGSTCPYQVSDSTPPGPSYVRQNNATEQLFLQASQSLGYGLTGEPLASPKLAADGCYQMAFENVVLFIDPTSKGLVRLRPLPSLLGIQAEAPGAEQTASWLSFYVVQGEAGFNIPSLFIAYLSAHGGMQTSGPPIAEYHMLEDGGFSQCFTNLCLEYHPTAPQSLQTRPHRLGAEYLSLGERTSASSTSMTDALQIEAWEDYPLIPSGQSQRITIEASQNKLPLQGLAFSLVVTQPDGLTKTYTLEPTGPDGITHVELDPINGPNGAIVAYKICVLGEAAPHICFSRSYTIWEQ
jgi:hypothetical protein